MTSSAEGHVEVTGGVDTHRDSHVAAVVDHTDRFLGTREFASTRAGHRQLLRWLCRHGELVKVGVEGTGAWGAGLARFLTAEGVQVVEVDRPNRLHRRPHGTSDPADAESAARTALNGDAADRSTLGHPGRGARPARHPPHPARDDHRTSTAGTPRSGHRHRWGAPRRRRRQPPPAPQRSILRRVLRREPHRRVLRTTPTPPAQPRRRPISQPGPLAHRAGPHGHLPQNPRLRATTHQQRTLQGRDHPLPQARHRPRDLQRLAHPRSTGASV